MIAAACIILALAATCILTLAMAGCIMMHEDSLIAVAAFAAIWLAAGLIYAP